MGVKQPYSKEVATWQGWEHWRKSEQAQSARESRLRNRRVTGKMLLRVIQKDRQTYKAVPPSKLRHCGAVILETKVEHPIRGIIILSVSSVRLTVSWLS